MLLEGIAVPLHTRVRVTPTSKSARINLLGFEVFNFGRNSLFVIQLGLPVPVLPVPILPGTAHSASTTTGSTDHIYTLIRDTAEYSYHIVSLITHLLYIYINIYRNKNHVIRIGCISSIEYE